MCLYAWLSIKHISSLQSLFVRKTKSGEAEPKGRARKTRVNRKGELCLFTHSLYSNSNGNKAVAQRGCEVHVWTGGQNKKYKTVMVYV